MPNLVINSDQSDANETVLYTTPETLRHVADQLETAGSARIEGRVIDIDEECDFVFIPSAELGQEV